MKRIFSILINIYKKYGHLFQGKLFWAFILFYKHQREWGAGKAIKYVFREMGNIHVIKDKDKVRAIGRLLSKVRINTGAGSGRFVYSIDECVCLRLKGKVLGNCCIDYRKVVCEPLHSLRMDGGSEYAGDNNALIDIIDSYLDRTADAVRRSDMGNKEAAAGYLENMKEGKAGSLEEALQRILFINSIQWQTGHILVGLGRLDQVLDGFASDDRSDEEILEILKDFLQRLHEGYCLKSNALMGDTGQIIILAGNNEDDSYFCNRFTYLFLDVVKEINLPDPKVLVRVSSKTPDKLWDRLTDLVSEDCGSPLISNDDEVIPRMVEFGYSKASACGYTTSACWEPMPSECCEQNNIVSVNYLEPFEYIRKSGKEVSDRDTFMKLYYEGLKAHIDSVLAYIDGIEWEKDPILSLYNTSSRKKGLDVSLGGGEYNNYGLLTVGMSNAVKSIRNISELVFEKNVFSYKELDDCRADDFRKRPDIRDILSKMPDEFGEDSAGIAALVNEMTEKTKEMVSGYRNRFGGKVKIGLSSPHYIMNCSGYPASFDGRKKGDPFAVHISNEGSGNHLSLLNFASSLDYGDGRFNGNVVDMIISPAFLSDDVQKDKLKNMIRTGFDKGVFQLQMNSFTAAKLKKAKEHPEDFPNLMVRVWGFNAYFVQLPEEYQDYLIARAERYERAA